MWGFSVIVAWSLGLTLEDMQEAWAEARMKPLPGTWYAGQSILANVLPDMAKIRFEEAVNWAREMDELYGDTDELG